MAVATGKTRTISVMVAVLLGGIGGWCRGQAGTLHSATPFWHCRIESLWNMKGRSCHQEEALWYLLGSRLGREEEMNNEEDKLDITRQAKGKARTNSNTMLEMTSKVPPHQQMMKKCWMMRLRLTGQS